MYPFPRWLLLFGVLLVLASGLSVAIRAANLGSAAGMVDQAEETSRLLQTDREFAAKSTVDGAATAFAAYLTEDALQLAPGSDPIEGRQAIVARLRGGEFVLTWEPRHAEVARSGELGYTWGTDQLCVQAVQGELRTTYGKYANVWRKQPDGAWKVALDVGNENQSR